MCCRSFPMVDRQGRPDSSIRNSNKTAWGPPESHNNTVMTSTPMDPTSLLWAFSCAGLASLAGLNKDFQTCDLNQNIKERPPTPSAARSQNLQCPSCPKSNGYADCCCDPWSATHAMAAMIYDDDSFCGRRRPPHSRLGSPPWNFNPLR
jgi:hypothetical protein